MVRAGWGRGRGRGRGKEAFLGRAYLCLGRGRVPVEIVIRVVLRAGRQLVARAGAGGERREDARVGRGLRRRRCGRGLVRVSVSVRVRVRVRVG